jgi:hypothetical protein
MRRAMDYQTYLAALKLWFHQGQVPGEVYKPEPVYHSLGARGGGQRDGNSNLLDKNGRVIGRDAAFYPIKRSESFIFPNGRNEPWL